MADLLIIIRDAFINSYTGSLASAMLAKQEGLEVEVLFVQEAIVALTEKKFRMSPVLEPYQGKLTEVVKGFGLSTDPVELVGIVKKAGVPLFTCPIWTEYLGIKDHVPEEIEILELPKFMDKIIKAKKILGTF